MQEEKRFAIIIYILAFLVPVAVMTFAFAVYGAYPFGNNTVMTGDTTYQFVDYLSYLKTIIGGDNDFIYSLSKNLGGEMAGFAAYYYYNPLNFITLLFPSQLLPAGIFVILVLAPGLCSLSMCYVLGRIYGLKKELLIFSYAYGLMAYIVVYNELFEYYTNLCLLPLIFYGLIRLIKEKRMNYLYLLCLAAAIMNNYYTAYMICIFCLIWFIYSVLCDAEGIKSTKAFIASSLCAGGLSAFILLPAVMSLRGEKNQLSVGFFRLFEIQDIFSKFYTGSFKGDFGAGLPNIYCSMAVTAFFIFYFFNRAVRKREKILTGLVVLFFILNFCINTLNVVWHGFNRPIGFPHRFSFLFVFFVIIKATEAFEKYGETDRAKAVIFTGAVFILYSVYLIIRKNPNTDVSSVVISLFMLVLSLLFTVGKNGILTIPLIFAVTMDLCINAVLTLGSFDLTKMDEFQKAYRRTDELVSYLKNEDDGLYRTEKYFRRTHNDAFMHDYAGLSHFSSSEKMSTIRFMGRLGFRDNGNWAFYGEGNDSFIDSLFGVKYVLSQYGATGKPYEKIYGNEEGYSIFKNPYALPLLFAAGEQAEDIVYEDFDDPFLLQQTIADAVTGDKNGIFKRIPAEKTYEDDKTCVFKLKTVQDGIVDAYFTAPRMQENVHIYLNGADYGQYFYTYRWNVLDLGEFEAGTELEISFASPDGDSIEVDEGYIYNEDFDALKKFYKKVTSKESELKKISSSRYTGRAVLKEKEELVFSVPYDEGWRAYVDGKRTKTGRAAGNLLGVRAGEGEHSVEFKYVSPGQTAGNAVSLIAVLFILIPVVRKHSIGAV